MTAVDVARPGDYAAACLARCWDCRLAGHDTEHPNGPHTWMDSDDIESTDGVRMPTTPEEWADLTVSHPCGCWCVRQPVRADLLHGYEGNVHD